MTIKTTFIAIAAAAAVIAPLATATDAEAGRGGGKATYYEPFNTRYAERGYEGFVGGKVNSYCSYRREPRRRCYITRSGYERCKIVGWKLIQHCY